MERLNARLFDAPRRPVKVLQYGEGNFLRAFVDYMLDIANEKAGFDGGVALVKPIPMGSLQPFHEQDGRYTVLLRGLEDGHPVEKTRLVTCVRDAVDACAQYDRYAGHARPPGTVPAQHLSRQAVQAALRARASLRLCPGQGADHAAGGAYRR